MFIVRILIVFAFYVYESGQEQCLDSLSNTVTLAENYYNKMAENQQQMERLHNGTSYIPILHITEDMLQKHFDNVLNYNHNKYLLSSYRADVSVGQFVCAMYGGYLVEIDNEQEFVAVQQFVRSSHKHRVFIGADDIGEEKRWVHSFSGTPAHMRFHPSEPNKGREENCVVFASSLGSLMGDIACDTYNEFLCEIPDVNGQ